MNEKIPYLLSRKTSWRRIKIANKFGSTAHGLAHFPHRYWDCIPPGVLVLRRLEPCVADHKVLFGIDFSKIVCPWDIRAKERYTCANYPKICTLPLSSLVGALTAQSVLRRTPVLSLPKGRFPKNDTITAFHPEFSGCFLHVLSFLFMS